MADKKLQLRRSDDVYSNKSTATSKLAAQLRNAEDGEPIIAYYNGSEGEKRAIIGFGGTDSDVYFECGAETASVIAAIKGGSTKTIKELEVTLDNLTGGSGSGSIQQQIANAIDELKGGASSQYDTLSKIETLIKALDLATVGGTSSLIQSIKQEDGKIEAVAITIGEGLKVDGNTLKVNLTDSGGSAPLISTADAMKFEGGVMRLQIASTDKVLTQTSAGLMTNLTLDYNKSYAGNSNKPTILLKGVNGDVISMIDATDFLVDGMLDNVRLEGNTLSFTFNTDSKKSEIKVNLSEYIKPYDASNGITINPGGNNTNPSIAVKIDETTESYLTVGEGGVKLSGIDKKISDSINALDKSDTAVDGEFVTKVEETDGVIAVTRGKVAANKVTATKVGSGTATDVQGILGELNTAIANEITARNTAIDDKIKSLDKADSAQTNQYVTAVSETDGIITVSRAQPSAGQISSTAVTNATTQTNVQGALNDIGALAAKGMPIAGNGIGVSSAATGTTVSAKIVANVGLKVDANGLATVISANGGIKADGSGFAVKLPSGSFLKTDNNGLDFADNVVIDCGTY